MPEPVTTNAVSSNGGGGFGGMRFDFDNFDSELMTSAVGMSSNAGGAANNDLGGTFDFSWANTSAPSFFPYLRKLFTNDVQ